MTSGEGRVCLVLPQHPGYLLCPHTRACGWWRSGGWSCLGHLLASLARPVFFFGYSSVFCFFIFVLPPFGSPVLGLLPLPLPVSLAP